MQLFYWVLPSLPFRVSRLSFTGCKHSRCMCGRGLFVEVQCTHASGFTGVVDIDAAAASIEIATFDVEGHLVYSRRCCVLHFQPLSGL